VHVRTLTLRGLRRVEEPRRATRVAFAFHVALSDVDLRELGFAGVPVRLQVTGLEHPALFVYPCGGVLVEQHVRRPTTRLGRGRVLQRRNPSVVVDKTERARSCLPLPEQVVALSGSDPACVHVDCAGPVRENVPGNGLLGEGLTGEHNRLKRGLKSRTPAGPLLSLRGRGGGEGEPASGLVRRRLLSIPPVNGSAISGRDVMLPRRDGVTCLRQVPAHFPPRSG